MPGSSSTTQMGEPYVSLSFDSRGARVFERITGDNVGKRLAIVLDDKVYSAPVIRDKISGGKAQITGAFTMDDAKDLAIVLRAGALPAPVKILEERTVGPSLGKDSIDQGFTSMVIGLSIILILVAVYYRLSGIIADIALLLNIPFIMGGLALFGATLTLPGIAGVILSIAMSVDANVLIYERIREELRLGKPARAAMEAGFARAFVTILDSNLTTADRCPGVTAIRNRPSQRVCGDPDHRSCFECSYCRVHGEDRFRLPVRRQEVERPSASESRTP